MNNLSNKTETPAEDSSGCKSRLCRLGLWLALVTGLLVVVAVGYLLMRFVPDRPVAYDNIEEHFKYGSTGGERESGFPLRIFQVLPEVCREYLPGEGYASLGLLYESGKTLPIGLSQRRVTGLDRTFLNCAVCHVGTVRDGPEAEPRVILGMPANNLKLRDFQRFFTRCAADPRFSSEWIIPRLAEQEGGLSLFDRYLVYPIAIAIMRERLLMLRQRLAYVDDQPDWGPGRVDTFSPAKALFNFPFDQLPERERIGTADYPSIWYQGPREGMHLHWDGNNILVDERNKNAAFGTGTTPPTIDLAAIARLEEWMLDAAPPAYPYAIDQALAARGKPLYAEYCADCHGAGGADFSGAKVGSVEPIDSVATDRARLDNFTYLLSVNLGTQYAGYPWRFTHFRKTHGYANMPLDGLWLRAPYLHNGSVPSLRDLLDPADQRPPRFYRGNDVYDQARVGFVSDLAEQAGRRFFAFDTSLAGNGNGGHEGRAFGTELPDPAKDALVEYLKTF